VRRRSKTRADQARAGAEPDDGAASPARPAALPESEDFVDDNNRLTIADKDVFARDPVNLIRMFRLAQKHNLVLHPDVMRLANKSLKLISPKVRHDPVANQLFLEILTSHDAEIILRRMNEIGVLGRFVRAFGRVVAMMQFNMYHHYTVDEHLFALPRRAGRNRSRQQRGVHRSPTT
jgi:UTP:GlnB (protein PII) uridylyltransferase